MTRRCSHCSNNGHNSRTCPSSRGANGGVVKLFGVRLNDGSMIKKSASMGTLNLSSFTHHHSSSSSSNLAAASSSSPNPGSPCSDPPHDSGGYLSDDHLSTFTNPRGERKKGVPWTAEEHRMFLVGLQKLGKGDWRGIARNFVVSRTPTQVASHAQKHFIRQSHATRRKRRSSLFDMVPDMSSDPPSVPEEQVLLPFSENSQPSNGKSQPSLSLSLKSEFEPMEITPEENLKDTNGTMMGSIGLTPMAPHGFFPTYLPVPFPVWPSTAAHFEEVKGGETSHHHFEEVKGGETSHHHFEEVKGGETSHPYFEEVKGGETSHHQVHRPIPVKEPVNVAELVGMSHLSIEEARIQDREPSALSLKLIGEPSRQSAFHANAPVSGSDLNSGKNSAIQAV